MKWFSIDAIIKEIAKIRWPKKNDLLTSVVQVIIFIAFFALFFYICQVLISLLLSTLGVI